MRPYQRRFPHIVTIGGVVENFRDLGVSRGGGRKGMATIDNPAADDLGPSLRVVVKAYGKHADNLQECQGQRVLVEGALSFDRFNQLEVIAEKVTRLDGEQHGKVEGPRA